MRHMNLNSPLPLINHKVLSHNFQHIKYFNWASRIAEDIVILILWNTPAGIFRLSVSGAAFRLFLAKDNWRAIDNFNVGVIKCIKLKIAAQNAANIVQLLAQLYYVLRKTVIMLSI